jgi:hypothetical protein
LVVCVTHTFAHNVELIPCNETLLQTGLTAIKTNFKSARIVLKITPHDLESTSSCQNGEKACIYTVLAAIVV